MLSFLKSLVLVSILAVTASIISKSNPELANTAGIVVLVVSVIAIFKPQPQIYLHSRGFAAAIAIFVGLPLIAGDPDQLKSTDRNASVAATTIEDEAPEELAGETQTVPVAASEAESINTASATPKAAEVAKRQDVIDLMGQIDREIDSIPDLDPSSYGASNESIMAGNLLIGAWSLIYEKGASLPLTDDEEARRQKFKSLVVDAQARMLPAMRDGYGPALRKQLWEADGTARTTGAGFRTITVTLPEFIRNRNIKEGHEAIRDMLMMLRFTRAEYKWAEHAEYSFYTLEPPADTQLGRWGGGGIFIPIE